MESVIGSIHDRVSAQITPTKPVHVLPFTLYERGLESCRLCFRNTTHSYQGRHWAEKQLYDNRALDPRV
jgi:hypothetical protein